MILRYGFDIEKYWQFGQPWDFSLSEYVYQLISVLAYGSIVGGAQSLVIKTHNVNAFRWILATVIGFCLLIVIEWPLLYMEVGNIPGPVEPMIATVGGSIFAGIIQHFMLGKLGVNAGKWLLLWIIGLILSIIPTGLFFTFIVEPIGFSWPLEIFFTGFLVGGVAAWISGKALFTTLSTPN